MRTTPNLGLKVWDLSTDPYEHVDLAGNWDKIDALATALPRSVRQITTLTPGVNGPVNPPANGDLCICLSAVASFAADTLIRYNGATWSATTKVELASALPTTENYIGRLIFLTAAAGAFASGTLVQNTDGANTWREVVPRSVREITTLTPGTSGPFASPAVGDLCMTTATVNSFSAGELIVYTGSMWQAVESVEVKAALPTTENYIGRMVLLTAAASPFEQGALVYNTDGVNAWAEITPRSVRLITTLTPGTNGPNNPPANGDLCLCSAATASFAADTLIRYDGTNWRAVAGLEVLAALPTTENFIGRVVLLTAASGSWSAGDLVRNTNGTSGWALVGPLNRSSSTGVTGYETSGDIYINSTTAGLILKDRTNGHYYRLFFTGGGLNSELVA